MYKLEEPCPMCKVGEVRIVGIEDINENHIDSIYTCQKCGIKFNENTKDRLFAALNAYDRISEIVIGSKSAITVED